MFVEDSLSIPRGRSSRRDDLEMGMQRSGEIGLKYFFEKVLNFSHVYICIYYSSIVFVCTMHNP